MGLEKTQTIGRIIVHPTNPNIVYVAALGAIWNANPERGLYKTTDGGTTWQLVKFISDKAGFVDVRASTRPTRTSLWASSYERVRGPYFLKSGGPGSRRSGRAPTPARRWTEVKGGGFPETMKGRIGIAIAPSRIRDVMYTMVEADTRRTRRRKTSVGTPADAERACIAPPMAARPGTARATSNVRPFYYSQVRVDPKNPDRVYWSSTPVNVSNDGGKTVRHDHRRHPRRPPRHVDRPERSRTASSSATTAASRSRTTRAATGGPQLLCASASSTTSRSTIAMPYHVCGGLQDNGSWCGPSRRQQGAITNAMWVNVSGGDGFVTQQDPTDPNIDLRRVAGRQHVAALNFATGERTSLAKPTWRGRGYCSGTTPSPCCEDGPTAARPGHAQKRDRRDPRDDQPPTRSRSTCAGTGTRRSSSRRTTRRRSTSARNRV